MANLLNTSTWAVGNGSFGQFVQYGLDEENDRFIGKDPWGQDVVLWHCIKSGTDGSTYDGGFSTTLIDIDRTYRYRFSIWVNRTVVGNGNFYLSSNGYAGASNTGLIRIDTEANETSAYFYYGTDLIVNTWMLVVGHIHPYGYTGTTHHPDSGRWKLDGTRHGVNLFEFKWRSDATKTPLRSFVWGSTNPVTRQLLVYPRLDKCDGTEPRLQGLIRNGTYHSNLKINSGYLSVQCKDVPSN
jgi:hypothetical protein